MDSEHTGRELLQEHLKKAGLPAQKISGSSLLADVIREMGFRKAEEFYVALGAAKISPKTVVNKVMQRAEGGRGGRRRAERRSRRCTRGAARPRRRRTTRSSSKYGITVDGVHDVPLRLAKCCRPVSGDSIVGYVSLGRGITIHRDGLPERDRPAQGPRPLRRPSSGTATTRPRSASSCRSTAGTAHRMLEDLSRSFAEAGVNILEARCTVVHPMVRNRFVVEVAEAQTLKTVVTRLRAIESVFDAYRVTPTGG